MFVSSVVATAALFVGGAWFASSMPMIGPSNAVEKNQQAAAAPVIESGGHATNAAHNTGPTKETAEDVKRENRGNSVHQYQPLEVTIEGIKKREGKIVVLVFNEKTAFENYDYTRAVGYAELNPTSDSLSVTFDNLKDGPFAVALFHDENGNRDLDAEGGYPTEGYGVSGASSAYDEPSFEKAATYSGRATITAYYLLY